MEQQTRTQRVSLTPLEIAGLLAILRFVQFEDVEATPAAAHLQSVISRDSGIEVHDDALGVCLAELSSEIRRGSDLVQG